MSHKYELICEDCNRAVPCELKIDTDLTPTDITQCPIEKRAHWKEEKKTGEKYDGRNKF